MGVTTIAGDWPNWPGFRRQSFSQSTATAFQSLSFNVQEVTLGMGTSTGRNLYLLASGAVPGQEISILSTATGEARVLIFGTATGMHVFTEADDFVRAIYLEGKWRIIQSSATLSTGT